MCGTRGSTRTCAESDVVTLVVLNKGLGEECVVLNLRLSERRSVRRKDDELGLTRPEGLEGGPVSKRVLAGLHHKREPVAVAVAVQVASKNS